MDSSQDNGPRYEPLPRWGHASVTIGTKVYMWGGRIEDFSETSKQEVRVPQAWADRGIADLYMLISWNSAARQVLVYTNV